MKIYIFDVVEILMEVRWADVEAFQVDCGDGVDSDLVLDGL